MAIGNGEEMCTSVLTQVWQHEEGVLIDFVWILRRIASLGRKSEFCDAIVELLACLARLDRMLVLRCAHLLGDRGADVLAAVVHLLSRQLRFDSDFGISSVTGGINGVISRLIWWFAVFRPLAQGALVAPSVSLLVLR